MKKKEQKEVVCIFCGNHRQVTYWEDDGVDYCGHARGHSDSGTIDNGCNCEFGSLVKNKALIKPMCLNCKSYKDGFCVNKLMLDKMKDMFDMGDKLKVNKPERHCECYQLNMDIFKEICN